MNPYRSATDAGDVRGIADTTRYHLRSAYAIAQIAAPAEAPDPEAMDRLLRQLESGVPADALDLLALPIPLARGEYLALAAAGLRTVSAVWSAAPAQLVGILGEARARELIARRPGTTPVTTRTPDADVARRQPGAA